MRGGVVGLLLVGAMSIAVPSSDAAAKLVVTKLTDDTPDGCTKSDCSLREAVIRSNQTKDVVEKIVLGPNTYSLTIAGTDEDAAATGDLDVTRPVKIVGVTQQTIISQDAAPDDRIFHVLGKGSLALTGVNVTGGSVAGAGGGILAAAGRKVTLTKSALSLNTAGFNGLGGGIATDGPLTITDSVVQFNSSGGGAGGIASGGGIDSKDSNVTITRSSVVGNATDSHNGIGGGGLYHNSPGGDLDVIDSTIDSNSADSHGGGILSFGPRVTTTISRSTISNNSALGSGGGIFTFEGNNNPAQTRILNSTLSGNSAALAGGGLFCACPAFPPPEGDDPYSTIMHSTIVGNTADSDNNSAAANGGGFAGSGQVMEIGATIIADNIDAGETEEDCGDYVAFSLGANVTTETGCFSIVYPDVDPDVVIGTADFLGPLQDNGGPTETHALLDDTSTAGDRHVGAACGGTDQRGVPRPVGDGCDSGAYEYVECFGRSVNIVGTQGKDVLTGTIGPDAILALGGNDTVFGGLGNDYICGGRGNDKLFGEDDADSLFGEAGDDTLDGGTNLDECDGGRGRDKLISCELEPEQGGPSS